MLLKFSMKNFRSFYDKSELIVNESEDLANGVNVTCVFGEHASGKTNVVRAMKQFREFIVNPSLAINDTLPIDPFTSHSDENTFFQIVFIKNNERFTYSLEYNALRIIKEVLLMNDVVIFERSEQNFIKLPEQIESMKDNIRENQTLLFFAQSNNVASAKMAYDWFANDLMIVNLKTLPLFLNEKLRSEESFRKNVVYYLRQLGFAIKDIEVFEQVSLKYTEDYAGMIQKSIYQIYSVYQLNGDEMYRINLKEDNASLIKLLHLLTYGLNSERKTLIVDAFDDGLNDELAKQLLSIIVNDLLANQFVLTTSHYSRLMHRNIMMSQRLFIEKDENGKSFV